jgi:hypothetical protein
MAKLVKPILKSLCPDHILTSDYVIGRPLNCFTCVYGTGTKCEEMHRALAAMERKHNAFSHMMDRTNRRPHQY